MHKSLYSTFVFLGLLLCVTQPTPVQAQTTSTESEYREVLFKLIETLQIQIQLLQSELENGQNTISLVDSGFSYFIDSVDVLATYEISRPSDVKKIEDANHQAYFERMFELFPSGFDGKIKQLVVFDDQNVDYASFVETLPPDQKFWLYGTGEDMMNYIHTDTNVELVVHELAHIVSYEEISGIPKLIGLDCADYFKRLGCPPNNTYIYEFVDEFWPDEELVRVEDQSVKAETPYDYYLAHDTKFVSDYATVGPEEDFAETFMFFVLDLAVEGQVAEQKVAFMESFPELRSLRSEIIKEI